MDLANLMEEAEAMTQDGSLETRPSLVVGLMLSYLRSYARENAELQDQVWAAKRWARADDPWEGEDA